MVSNMDLVNLLVKALNIEIVICVFWVSLLEIE